MPSLHVVLLQSDSQVAQSLFSALSNSFDSVHLARSLSELRTTIVRHRARIAILDLERASLSDVKGLSRDFPGASIICTHRCADEEMWTAALNAGASDVCPSSDTSGIVRAAVGNAAGRAAAA
jgi:DNA-binding NarL/FixJ family response regulator